MLSKLKKLFRENPLLDVRRVKRSNELKYGARRAIAVQQAVDRSTGVIEFDLDGTIRSVNSKFLEQFGYLSEDLIGQHHRILVSETESGTAEYELLWRRLNAGEFQAGEFKQIAKSRQELFVHVSYNPILDSEGRPCMVVAHVHPSVNEQAHVALREISALRSALDDHAIFSVLDQTGRILEVNDEFCSVSGYKRDELVGQFSRIINSGFHPTSFWANIWQLLSDGRAWRGQVCNRRKDGSLFWVDSTMIPFTGSNGLIEKYISIQFDVTEQKESAEALASARAILEQTGRLAKIGGWELDTETMTPSWSHEVYRIHEVEIGSQPGLEEAINFYTPESRDRITAAVERAIAHGESWDLDLSIVTAKGRKIWVKTIGIPEMNQGRCTKLWGTFQDITEQRDREIQLRSTARRLESATQGAQVGIWEYVVSDESLIWDSTTHSIHGTSSSESENCIDLWWDSIHPDDRMEVERKLAHAVENEDSLKLEYRVVHPDGATRQIQVSAIVRRDEPEEEVRLYGASWDITQRRTTEEALKKSEDRFARAVAGSTDALWDYSPRTGEVWFSDRFRQLLGFKPENYDEFPNSMDALFDRLHPDDKEPTKDAIEDHLAHGTPYDVSFRVKTGQCEYRWFRARGLAARDSHGVVESMAGSITDIHEQRTSKERLEIAMRAAHEGLWDWHVQSGEMSFNVHCSNLLRCDLGDLPKSIDDWQRRIHPEDVENAMSEMRQHLDGKSDVYRSEHRIRRADGSWLWVLCVGEIVERLENGLPKRMTGVLIDIGNLKEMNSRLEIALAAANAGLWDWNVVKGTFTSNETFHAMIGEEPIFGEIPLEYFVSRMHVDDRDKILKAIGNAHDDDRFDYDVEFRLQCYNGEYKWIRSTGKVVERAPDGTATRMIGQHMDVDTRVRSKEKVEQLNEELAANIAYANNLAASAEAANAAKSEFLANMSHEIRTPMTAILGYADLLVDECEAAGANGNLVERVEPIRRNAEYLLTIINDILDVSKIEARKVVMEKISFAPAQIVSEVISLLQQRASEKGIDLRLEYTSKIPEKIISDPTRVRQILLNLVGNAIKFTDVGSVTVEVDFQAGTDARPKMRFGVVDTGIGMSPATRDRIASFDAFNQADGSTTRKFGGSGLGLRISNCFAEMLDGKIEVESTLGKGSRFTAVIGTGPLNDVALIDLTASERQKIEANSKGPKKIQKPNADVLNGRRLLLAEDGPDNQRLISFLLKKAGAEVEVVGNGRLALEAAMNAVADDNPFDVILMDMQMPEMDGYTATAELRRNSYNRPVIALTAHAMSEDRDKCLRAGCDDYATKPINRSALIEMVASYAEGTSKTRDRGENSETSQLVHCEP